MPVDGQLPTVQGRDADLLLTARDAFDLRPETPARVGVAVSGGSDSMAMLHLMARAVPEAGGTLHAVTVDHRLRPEAAGEAAFVGRVCAGLGVPHDVLVWDHGKVRGNLMQAASEARYRLMAGWAAAKGIGQIALAHTADDQAETFLMGLSRGAGLDGLVGMRPGFTLGGIAFRRPFLMLGRAELRDYLTRHGAPWIDDPSNDNDRFTRVRARRALKALKPLGITLGRLSGVIANLSMAQGVVHEALARAAREAVTEAAGSLRLERRPFVLCGAELQRRLLIGMVRWIGGDRHAPRESKLAALAGALDRQADATLGGVRFRWQGEVCTVSREARACGGAVPVGRVWDGRWSVTGAEGEIRALGPAGLRQCPDWRATGLSRQVLEVTPGVWQGDRLVAAPCAGFGAADATCAPGFHAFLLSH